MKVIYVGKNENAGNVHSDFTEQGIPFEFHVVSNLSEAILLSDDGCVDVICHPKLSALGNGYVNGFLNEAKEIHKLSAGGLNLIDGGGLGMATVSTKPKPKAKDYIVQTTASQWSRLSSR